MTRPIHLLLATATGLLPGLAAPSRAQVASPARVLAFQDALKGTDEESLRWPVASAAASDEEVAVADAASPRLLRFRRVGVSWQLDRAVPIGATPAGLAWDGRRYVASLRQGGGLAAFEGAELAQRKLPLPRGVVPGALAADPAGHLLVYDSAGRRVLRLGADGGVSAEIAVGDDVAALAATAAGGFYAAVASAGSVLHFNAAGSLDATWTLPASEGVPAWPTGLVAEAGGDVFVVDRHAGRILLLDGTGQVRGVGARQGWEPGLLLFPAGIARLPGGLLLVADEGNGRAQLFRRTDLGTRP